MSDEQPKGKGEPSEALTGEVRTSVLVPRENGGALRSGGRHPKITNPTASDVAVGAQRYLYRELPRLRRIAHNEQQRPKAKPNHGKAAKGAKTATRMRGRREFTIEQQLSAFRVLSEIAKLDRTVRVAAVDEFIAGVVDDVRAYLPKESADVLLAMFKHRARRI